MGDDGVYSRKGGYLRYFLWYDLVAFMLCLAFIAYVITTRPKNKIVDWPVEHAVYATQIVYAMLSFPFFIFTLPGIQVVLTHARPTAYDNRGRCRKPKQPPALEESHDKAVKTAKAGNKEVVSEEEATSVLSKLLQLYGFS